MANHRNHVTSIGTYLVVFASLIALTALTVVMAFQDLGAMNNVVALGIAVAKGTLVVIFFMHVRHSTTLVKFVVIAGFFWLAILMGLTFADYATRGFFG